MHYLSSLTIAGLLAAATVSAQNSTIKCAEGLKMFVSRGTGEPMGLGETGKLVKAIAEQIPGSDYQAIPYPASNGNSSNSDPSYFESVGEGTLMVRETMKEYATACPNSKMAWFGYSQGAQITSNSFCGMPVVWGVYAGYSTAEDIPKVLELSSPLPEEVTKNVVSVVLFGDTTHSNDTSYNYGTYNNTGNGIFYRAGTGACEELGDRIRSYCDAGDPFCDVGDFLDLTAHLKYVINYGEEVAKFVVGQFTNDGNSTDGSGDGPTETSSSSTPVPTSGTSGLSAAPGALLAASLFTYLLL